MKEIRILIRFDDDNGKFGFVVDRTKEDANSQSETLKLIAALDILKQKEMCRMQRIGGFEGEYKDGEV